MQFLTEQKEIAPKLKQRLFCSMRRHKNDCLYVSNRKATPIIKKKYFKKQISNGLFTLLISAAILLITTLISTFTQK